VSDDDLLKIKALAMANRRWEARREAEKYAARVVEPKMAAKTVTAAGETDVRDLTKQTSNFFLAELRLA
jgi:hypothetical protein